MFVKRFKFMPSANYFGKTRQNLLGLPRIVENLGNYFFDWFTASSGIFYILFGFFGNRRPI